MTSSTMLTTVLLVSQLALTAGFIVIGFGSCPDVPPMKNFDINRYMGKWYAQESFDAPFQAFAHCISANYTLLPEARVRVLNRGVKGLRIGNKLYFQNPNIADGFAVIPDPSVPSALRVDFGGPSADDAPANYIIQDTDYDNYAVVWSCSPLWNVFRVEVAWILSRARYTPPANTPQLKQNLADLGINVKYFKKIYQDIC